LKEYLYHLEPNGKRKLFQTDIILQLFCFECGGLFKPSIISKISDY